MGWIDRDGIDRDVGMDRIALKPLLPEFRIYRIEVHHAGSP